MPGFFGVGNLREIQIFFLDLGISVSEKSENQSKHYIWTWVFEAGYAFFSNLEWIFGSEKLRFNIICLRELSLGPEQKL